MRQKQLKLLVQAGRAYDYRVERGRRFTQTIALLKEEHLIDDDLLDNLRRLEESNAGALAAATEFLLDELRPLSRQVMWHPSEWRKAIADTHHPSCRCSFCKYG
jgi:hypothetical protein